MKATIITLGLLAAALPATALVSQPPAASGTATAPAAPTAAAPANRMADKLINSPGAGWNLFGAGQTNVRIERGGPRDYPAYRVTVPRKTANAWDAGALSPITKPLGARDVVLLAVYLRAPALKDGETTPLSYVGINQSSAPYTQLAASAVAVTNQWKLYYASGRADRAYAPDAVTVGVHLGNAPHVVELGPVLVYNMGAEADIAKLPANK